MTSKQTKDLVEGLAPSKIRALLPKRNVAWALRVELMCWIKHLRAARRIVG